MSAYVWGSAVVTVRATGADALFLDVPVSLQLEQPPAPEWRLEGASSLNRQTGLIEQRITVRNPGERAIAGFELWLNTGDGTVLYNGMTALHEGPAAWLLPYFLPLAARESVTLVMEFHHPARRAQFEVASASVLDPLAPPHDPPPAGTAPFRITSAVPVNGSVLIEFPSVPGARYRMEYSPDNQSWSVCPIAITAGGTSVQWLDRGPPFTTSPPAAGGQRFYRVRRL